MRSSLRAFEPFYHNLGRALPGRGGGGGGGIDPSTLPLLKTGQSSQGSSETGPWGHNACMFTVTESARIETLSMWLSALTGTVVDLAVFDENDRSSYIARKQAAANSTIAFWADVTLDDPIALEADKSYWITAIQVSGTLYGRHLGVGVGVNAGSTFYRHATASTDPLTDVVAGTVGAYGALGNRLV